MRTIKFRAWDKINKEMFEVSTLAGHAVGDMQSVFGARDNLRLDYPRDCILMQFTGLLDKKGQEVFEGDVVNAWDIERFGSFNIPEDCIGREISRVEYQGEIIYKDGGFIIKGDDISITPWADKRFLNTDHNIEIIGNIWEHPELLSKSK